MLPRKVLQCLSGRFPGHGIIAPLLLEMLHSIQIELQRFERIANYWPVYAPRLEATYAQWPGL